jgi:hypothetical protein
MRNSRLTVATLSATAAFAASLVSGTVVAAAAPVFSPVVVSNSVHISEPGVNVAPDGTLYVNGPSGLLSNLPGSPSFVFRSDSAGATWVQTPPSLRANLPGGGDSNISVGVDGTLYMTDLWLGSSTVSVSHDKANTWTANPLQGVVVQDRQWVAASASGAVYHATHQIPLGLVVSKSLDGLVYPQHSIAATPVDQTGCVCPPGNLIAENGGGLLGTSDKVGLIYATSSGGVNFARSTNGALTFTNVAVSAASSAATNSNFPVVANAGNGHLAAVWLEVLANGTDRVVFNQSSDWGATWGTPRPIVTTGTSVYPWVDARGGKVAISLYNTPDAQATPDTAPANARWFESYLESTDGGSTFSGLVTVDPAPAKTGIVCTAGINCSSGRELGDFQSIALDNNGLPDVAWIRVDSTAPAGVDLMFAHGA